MKRKNTTKSDIVNDPFLLNDISKMILTEGNLANTSSNILNLLSSKIKSIFYIYFLVENNELVLQSFTTDVFKKLSRLIKFDVFKIRYPLDIKGMLIAKCVNEKKIIESSKLRDFFAPVFKPAMLLDTIQKIIGVKRCVGIPIFHEGSVIGAIGFATKKTRLTDKELNVLQLYANLSGIAISNSRQFQQIKKQYEMEKTTTSMLSHELKTPISIANNDAQLISFFLDKTKENMDPRLNRELRSRTKDIQENIDRMTKICNSIFSLREVESHIPEDIHKLDLENQLEPIIANFKIKAETKGLEFNVQIDKNSGKYYGGIVQFEQIITILLDNAIKYTDRGKIGLTIKIKNKKLGAVVFDTGCGIPKSQHSKIFDQFYRYHKGIKPRKKGLGLGLYIAKKIAGQIKGNITVNKNQNGKGSKFTVEIPVYPSQNRH